MKVFKIYRNVLFAITIFSGVSIAQIQSAQSGTWDNPSTWTGGVIPGAADNVLITDSAHSIYINSNFACNNLTINGKVEFDTVTARTITINGNLTINTTGIFKSKTTQAAVGTLIHTMTLKGDLTNLGVFDTRMGSNPNVGVLNIIFSGNRNSTITVGPYVSTNNEFNSVTIDKSTGYKVILGSDVQQNNNSTTAPSILQLTNGIIETGIFAWHVRSTSTGAGVQGGSAASYIVGTLVRYLSSGTNLTRIWHMGDETQYRPITLVFPTGISNAPLSVALIHGNANTGSSTFSGNIDKVSAIRYYKIVNLHSATIPIVSYTPSYGTDDGVASGNQHLRVAISENERALWTDKGPSESGPFAHTTDLTTPPTLIKSDTATASYASNAVLYVALAKVTGTNENSLPVELSSFSVTYSGYNILISWTTASEMNNRGFEILRSSDNLIWNTISFIKGAGNSVQNNSYSFNDKISAPGKYYYRLKQFDFNGNSSYSNVIETEVNLLTELYLSKNYPNPFNPSTMIKFSVPAQGVAALKIYNSLGQLISELFNGIAEPGKLYEVNFNASNLSSGLYISVIEFGGKKLSNKLLLIK